MLEAMPEPSIPWAKITETPQKFTISDTTAQPGKFGKVDVILILQDCKLSVWGHNYTYLYNTFGPHPKDWVGKDVMIWKMPDGKRWVEAAK